MELDLEFQIKANVRELKAQLNSVEDDVEAMGKALTKSFAGLETISKAFPGHFEKAKNNAKQLSEYLAKVSKQKQPYSFTQQNMVMAGFDQYTSSMSSEANKIKNEHANLVRARYALYDVASEGRRVGIIMTGIGVAAVKAGADFERAFIDVARTTGLTGTALGNLRDSLLEISKTSPISFEDITKIATLGAQMGIAAAGIDEFASTVAKFSAVTGVSVDTTATSFGRIAELLNVSASEYENLASSVLYAGRNSLATEEQILTLTSQIAASAAQAGFMADETIGLATALASLGIAPEQARGVILRLFSDFDKVVSENGKTLEDYASIMGKTSAQVADLWKTDAPAFFLEFTDALSKTSSSAEGMNGVLSALGIVETREVNVLQRLAGNHDLVKESLDNAGISYKEGSDAAEQFAQRAETLDAKLQRLGNNLLALTASIGEGIGAFLKPAIDIISKIVGALASNAIAVSLGAIGLVVSAGIGIFLLYKAAVAQAMASLFALKTTMTELSITGKGATISLHGLRAAISALGLESSLMNVSLMKSKFTMTGLRTTATGLVTTFARFIPQMAAIGAVMAIGEIATKKLNDSLEDVSGNIEEVAKAGKQLDDIQFFIKGENQINSINRVGQSLSDFQVSLKETSSGLNVATDALFSFLSLGVLSDVTTLAAAQKDIENVDNTLAELVTGGNLEKAQELYKGMAEQAAEVGFSNEKLAELMPNYTAAVESAIPAVEGMSDAQAEAALSGTELADVIKTRLTDSLIGGLSAQSSFAEAVYNFSEALVASKGSLSVWSSEGRKAISAFSGLIDQIALVSGNNMEVAIQATAAAISQIELAGGDASVQVQGLVARINSLYGLQLNGSTVTSIAQLQAMIANTGGIAASTRAEIDTLLGGGGYLGIMKAVFDQVKKSMASTTSSVKKQVRTINNFASDLKGIFSDIYDRAFGLGEATDGFESGWKNIKQGVEDAKDSVTDLKAELEDMTADKAVLTYQLGIAEKYGDTLRAVKIRAQLSKLDKDLAKKNEDLKDAQDATNMSLVGNTDAALANREAIRGQVKEAGELISAYASTVQANGKLPNAAQVKKYAADVVKSFTDQATSIGISASELSLYTKLITGFGTAATKVEKPTVKVSVDPVKTAMDAYLAEKKQTGVSVNPSVDTTALDAMWKKVQDDANKRTLTIKPVVAAEPPKPNSALTPGASYGLGAGGFVQLVPNATVEQIREIVALKNQITSINASKILTAKGKSEQIKTVQAKIDLLQTKAKFNSPYSTYANGGFVSGPGTSTSDSINARLSNGEYVIQASAVGRYGVDFLNAINQMRVTRPAASSPMASSAGAGSNVVYLSPEDRSLLRAAVDRPIALYTDNQKIAQSANAGNVLLAQRGMN